MFDKKEAYLGVDIGAHGIKLVELHKNKGRAQLWTYGVVDEPIDIHGSIAAEAESAIKNSEKKVSTYVRGDTVVKNKSNTDTIPKDFSREKKYADLLSLLLKKARVTTKWATVSLPVSYIFHAVLTFPRVDEKEIEGIVNAEVKKMLSKPIDQMQVVYQIIPTENNKQISKYQKVLVTAAPKDLISFYTNIFQMAGLQLQELETEAFALERSLVGHDKATSMIIDIGAERTNFFIVDSGLPMTHRSVQIGGLNFNKIIENNFGVDFNIAEQTKRDMVNFGKRKVDFGLFDEPIEAIIKEIQYGFDLFLHQVGNEQKRPEKIILTGGASVFPYISEKIKNRFETKVFIGDPWARVVFQQKLKPILDEIGPRMSVAIGLAMRNIV